MNYDAGKYDVAVIGAGHAGIEAALAAARLGVSTVVFTIKSVLNFKNPIIKRYRTACSTAARDRLCTLYAHR